MDTLKREISKEDYDNYRRLQAEHKLFDAIWDTLPPQITMGYGYYGAGLLQEKGKYYLLIEIGSSCD